MGQRWNVTIVTDDRRTKMNVKIIEEFAKGRILSKWWNWRFEDCGLIKPQNWLVWNFRPLTYISNQRQLIHMEANHMATQGFRCIFIFTVIFSHYYCSHCHGVGNCNFQEEVFLAVSCWRILDSIFPELENLVGLNIIEVSHKLCHKLCHNRYICFQWSPFGAHLTFAQSIAQSIAQSTEHIWRLRNF